MFKAGDIVRLCVNRANPKQSNNQYRFVRYSRYGAAVVVGTESKGTLQYMNPDYLELV